MNYFSTKSDIKKLLSHEEAINGKTAKNVGGNYRGD